MPSDQSTIPSIDVEMNPRANSANDLETLEKGLDALETGPFRRRSVKGIEGHHRPGSFASHRDRGHSRYLAGRHLPPVATRLHHPFPDPGIRRPWEAG